MDKEQEPDLDEFASQVKDYEAQNPRMTISSASGEEIVFCTPSWTALWRVTTIFSKEPCTVEWILGFKSGEVLVDIGANVGMYSVFAAIASGVRVYAFEPEAQNFALLNHNIRENSLSERVTAWPVALSDHSEFSQLYLGNTLIGGSCHSFGEKVDYNLKPFEPAAVQGAVATTLDSLIEAGTIPVPNHIKIDVDGFEHKVVAGAAQTLRNEKLSSVLVEISPNIDLHQALIKKLGEYGFTYDSDQVKRAMRTEGNFEGVAEYVFRR